MDKIIGYFKPPKRVGYTDETVRQMDEDIAIVRRLKRERREAIAKMKASGNGRKGERQ